MFALKPRPIRPAAVAAHLRLDPVPVPPGVLAALLTPGQHLHRPAPCSCRTLTNSAAWNNILGWDAKKEPGIHGKSTGGGGVSEARRGGGGVRLRSSSKDGGVYFEVVPVPYYGAVSSGMMGWFRGRHVKETGLWQENTCAEVNWDWGCNFHPSVMITMEMERRGSTVPEEELKGWMFCISSIFLQLRHNPQTENSAVQRCSHGWCNCCIIFTIQASFKCPNVVVHHLWVIWTVLPPLWGSNT